MNGGQRREGAPRGASAESVVDRWLSRAGRWGVETQGRRGDGRRGGGLGFRTSSWSSRVTSVGFPSASMRSGGSWTPNSSADVTNCSSCRRDGQPEFPVAESQEAGLAVWRGLGEPPGAAPSPGSETSAPRGGATGGAGR